LGQNTASRQSGDITDMSISLSNIDRISKYFHWHTQQAMYDATVSKLFTKYTV